MKRREFVKKSAFIGMMAPLAENAGTFFTKVDTKEPKDTICTFSKTFQWLDYDGLAAFLAEAGFDGIDLPVRPGGHVSPENVERDLPLAVKAAQKHGLTIPMIVTAITDTADPMTERVLKAAAQNGVKYYRMGYYKYDDRKNTAQNLEQFGKQLSALSEMNARYGLQGGYQNHVGTYMGAPVWDLWYLIRNLDPRHIGCQYDVRHAAAEGLNSWPLGFKAVASHVKHECIKDYIYTQDKDGRWGVKSVPLGTGAIDFRKYFSLREEFGISGPLSIHYEFPLAGDDESLPAKERAKRILPAVRKEVETLRSIING